MFESPELKNLSRYVRSYLGGLKTLCVEVDKQEWKYLEGGKGETVVFLHGGLGSKTQWRSVMQDYLPEYRVIAIDVPGLYVNQSFRFRKHSYRQFGVWLTTVFESLRLGPVHLVGMSLGSSIAAYYAAQNPQQVKSLVLLSFPTVVFGTDQDAAAAVSEMFDAANLRTVEALQLAYSRLYYKAPVVPRIVLRYNLREFRKYQDTLPMVLQEMLESRPVLVAGMRQIKAPTLVLHGMEDHIAPPMDLSEWQRRIPHVQYHEIPECGHMIHIEKPDEVARLHKALLRNAPQLARQVREQEDETGRFVTHD